MALDFGHLPRTQLCDIQKFTAPSTVINLQWQTWRKPRGRSMLNIFCIGSGGGGGGGFTGAASSARGGGGGGGAGGISRLTIPAFLLPDILYVQVCAGGQGVGSGGGTAGQGNLSLVSVYPDSAVANIVCSSGATPPNGGGTGTGAAGGGTGSVGTVATITDMPRGGLGIFSLVVGQNGAAGGAQTGAVGAAITVSANGPCTQGGSGGAGVTAADFAGGSFTTTASTLFNEVKPATPAAGSFNGSGGPQLWEPFFSFGGGGGSSSNAGVGGNGGNGAYGSGGGGGGGGTTGGRGGDGGSGIVIITAW